MNQFPSHFDAPEDAYQGFFRADSAKNAHGWAAVMSYPHVRVSATGRTAYYDTPEEYAARASWAAREATGWVRSEGVAPARLHESADKVHLLGGWTRYNAAGEPILENRVTYILTRIAGSWGIQARFGLDSFEDADADGARGAVDAVGRFMENALAGRFERCADACRLPLTLVGVGEVRRAADAGGLAAPLGAWAAGGASVRDVRAAQAGASGAVVAFAVDNAAGGADSAIAVVGRRNERWEVAGISTIRGG